MTVIVIPKLPLGRVSKMWCETIGWWQGFRPAHILASIQIAMAIMPRFSVSEKKPSGTLDEPPTQAHLS